MLKVVTVSCGACKKNITSIFKKYLLIACSFNTINAKGIINE